MAVERKRVVLTITGSESDGPQIVAGLELLQAALEAGTILNMELGGIATSGEGLGQFGPGHFVLSCHRNTMDLLAVLSEIADVASKHPDVDFVVVAGAGWAAALPGMIAACLYHRFKATNIFVVGVALESDPGAKVGPLKSSMTLSAEMTVLQIHEALSKPQGRDLAALLSMTELPGCPLWFPVNGVSLFGAAGWYQACHMAKEHPIPDELREAVANVGKKLKLSSWQPWGEAIEKFTPTA